MRKIEIKRATTGGLVVAKGELFEEKGMQFCLTIVDDSYNAIELSTGCNVRGVNKGLYTKDDALDVMRDFINLKTEEEWSIALDRVKNEYCSRYKFSMPVNEPA